MQHDNWKDLLIANQWLPPRYLSYKFPKFNNYDLTNWKKQANVKVILDQDNWKLQKSKMGIEKSRRIMVSAWKYYFTQELGLNFKNDSNIVAKLLQIKMNRSHPLHSILTENRYLNQTGYPFQDWINNGNTVVSFVVFNLFPGKLWCEKNFMDPFLFFQTKQEKVDLKKIISLMELIWIRHIKKIPHDSENEEIETAKKIFFSRHNDNDLFNRRKEWQKFGLSTNFWNSSGGIKRLEKLLADKFGKDLGIISNQDNLWNSSRFKKMYPNLNLSRCRYTDTYPVDLHHLLGRSEYPEFIYHKENVVPINTQIHAFITRKKWGSDTEKKYLKAQRAWIDSPSGHKIEVFDKIMKLISKEIKAN